MIATSAVISSIHRDHTSSDRRKAKLLYESESCIHILEYRLFESEITPKYNKKFDIYDPSLINFTLDPVLRATRTDRFTPVYSFYIGYI